MASQIFIATKSGALLSCVPSAKSLTQIGSLPNDVTGLATCNGKLWIARANGQLETKSINANDTPRHVGHATAITGLDCFQGNLYATTSYNNEHVVWSRAPIEGDAPWNKVCNIPFPTIALATACFDFYVATAEGKLYWRGIPDHNSTFAHMGHATTVTGMTGIGSYIFCTTSNGKLWYRNCSHVEENWVEVMGVPGDVADIAAI